MKICSFWKTGLLLVSTTTLLTTTVNASSCIPPATLDGSAQVGGITNEGIKGFMNAANLPYLFLPLAEPYIGALVSNYETPIQVCASDLIILLLCSFPCYLYFAGTAGAAAGGGVGFVLVPLTLLLLLLSCTLLASHHL